MKLFDNVLNLLILPDCSTFCSQVLAIVEDKCNINMFYNEFISVNMSHLFNTIATTTGLAADDSHRTSTDQSMDLVANLSSLFTSNKSSVILCHFDFRICSNRSAAAPLLPPPTAPPPPPLINDPSSVIQTGGKSIIKSKPTSTYNSSATLLPAARSSAMSRRVNYYKNNSRQNYSYDLGYSSASNRLAAAAENCLDNSSTTHSFYEAAAAVDDVDAVDKLNYSLKSSNSFLDLTSGRANTSHGRMRLKKLRKSDISSPVSFNHVTHLDKPVAIGKRYKVNY